MKNDAKRQFVALLNDLARQLRNWTIRNLKEFFLESLAWKSESQESSTKRDQNSGNRCPLVTWTVFTEPFGRWILASRPGD